VAIGSVGWLAGWAGYVLGKLFAVDWCFDRLAGSWTLQQQLGGCGDEDDGRGAVKLQGGGEERRRS